MVKKNINDSLSRASKETYSLLVSVKIEFTLGD